MSDLTYDEDTYEDLNDEDLDDESYSEMLDDNGSAEFIGALLPGPLKFLDPVGAAVGAAAGGNRGRRTPTPRVPTAGGRGYYQPPPQPRYVTHGELKSTLARVQRDVKRNAGAIKDVNARVASNKGRLDQQNTINVRQGRRITKLTKQIDQQSQTQMLMSLLNRTEDVEVVSSDAEGLPAGTKFRFERELDPMTLLLPALMSGDTTGGGGLNNPLLLVALLGK